MTGIGDFEQWRYYFLDLPFFALGVRSLRLEKRLRRMFEKESSFMKEGFLTLQRYLGHSTDEGAVEDFLRRTFWVKAVRESDAYTSVLMSKRRIGRYFLVEGIENLRVAARDGRPVILLTGHIGSFFIPAIAFSHLGFSVYPIARTVDTSPATPLPTRVYQKLNYRFSEMRFSSRYLYTDFAGRIDREIMALGRKGGIFWVAPDLPSRLYPYKRHPVVFFDRKATLPSGIIPWAMKRDAVFLTAWNRIEGFETGRFCRRLTIDEPIPESSDIGSILQVYADRLASLVSREPWQWLAIQVIHQFEEGSGTNA